MAQIVAAMASVHAPSLTSAPQMIDQAMWEKIHRGFDTLRGTLTASGADTLVVGWIPLLAVRIGGGGGGIPPHGGGPMADANLVLQTFDAARGRLVGQTRQSSYALVGGTRDLLAKQVLHDALVRAVPPLVGAVAPESQ